MEAISNNPFFGNRFQHFFEKSILPSNYTYFTPKIDYLYTRSHIPGKPILQHQAAASSRLPALYAMLIMVGPWRYR